MKIDFNWSDDGQVHTYCIVCHGETVDRRRVEGKTQYYCGNCRKMYDRWIKIDPGINWWIDDDGEYWHESSGVFVRNAKNEFLFFQRDVFPFSLTVPAGHVDKGETPYVAANRELEEEVGLRGKLYHIADEAIAGDSCSRGSDAHVWHAFLLKIHNAPSI
ncbi:MAG: NUDIX domain-containing protein, partial [Candidatus Saccharimonadales bacterium]